MATRTLKSGLDREADKKGLSGKERHRYIGGTLRNLEKRGVIKIHEHRSGSGTRRSAPTPKPTPKKTTTTPKPTTRPASPPPPIKTPTRTSFAVKKKIEPIHLEVKKNSTASKAKGYNVYSIYYDNGKQFDGRTFRKQLVAKQEASVEMKAYNAGLRRERFG